MGSHCVAVIPQTYVAGWLLLACAVLCVQVFTPSRCNFQQEPSAIADGIFRCYAQLCFALGRRRLHLQTGASALMPGLPCSQQAFAEPGTLSAACPRKMLQTAGSEQGRCSRTAMFNRGSGLQQEQTSQRRCCQVWGSTDAATAVTLKSKTRTEVFGLVKHKSVKIRPKDELSTELPNDPRCTLETGRMLLENVHFFWCWPLAAFGAVAEVVTRRSASLSFADDQDCEDLVCQHPKQKVSVSSTNCKMRSRDLPPVTTISQPKQRLGDSMFASRTQVPGKGTRESACSVVLHPEKENIEPVKLMAEAQTTQLMGCSSKTKPKGICQGRQ